DHQPPAVESSGLELAAREIARPDPGIEQEGRVARIMDERLHLVVVVESHPYIQLAVREAEMSQPSGGRLLLLVFLRVHEEHESGARRHRLDRRAPAERPGPEAAVAGFAGHGKAISARPSAVSSFVGG